MKDTGSNGQRFLKLGCSFQKIRCQPQPLCGTRVEKIHGVWTQNPNPKSELPQHTPQNHLVLSMSGCFSKRLPETWRPEETEKAFSCLPGLSTTAGPQANGSLPLFPEFYLFSKQIGNHYRTVLHFPTSQLRRQPVIISTVNSEKPNLEKWTRYPFPTMCVLGDGFKRLDQMLFLGKYKGRQSFQHMWKRQGNFTGFPEIAILYHTEAPRHQAQLFEFQHMCVTRPSPVLQNRNLISRWAHFFLHLKRVL